MKELTDVRTIRQQIAALVASLDQFESIYNKEVYNEIHKSATKHAIPWNIDEVRNAWIKVDSQTTRLIRLFRELTESLTQIK